MPPWGFQRMIATDAGSNMLRVVTSPKSFKYTSPESHLFRLERHERVVGRKTPVKETPAQTSGENRVSDSNGQAPCVVVLILCLGSVSVTSVIATDPVSGAAISQKTLPFASSRYVCYRLRSRISSCYSFELEFSTRQVGRFVGRFSKTTTIQPITRVLRMRSFVPPGLVDINPDEFVLPPPPHSSNQRLY